MSMLPSRAAQQLTAMIIDPKELLWGILVSLSKSRGAESYLFPLLMEKSRDVLGIMNSSPQENLSTTLAQMGQEVGFGDGLYAFAHAGVVEEGDADEENVNQPIESQGGGISHVV